MVCSWEMALGPAHSWTDGHRSTRRNEKGKPRRRPPFQRKGTACVAAACQNADQNMSPQRMSVCASPEVVYEAVPADDAMPDGLEVEVVVAAC